MLGTHCDASERVWLIAHERGNGLDNNKMQLTSGGLNGALRAPSSMRRLQLILVFCGRLLQVMRA